MRRQWVLAGAAAALAVAGLAAAGLRHLTPFPAHWDPRVVPIVRFVERERGRLFSHPVTVEFLAPTRFQAVLGSARPSTAGELASLGGAVAELRAVGLVSGQVDLRALVAASTEDEVLGVYQPQTKHVLIRGTELTPDVRVTVAHELTHALHDQEVDLAMLQDRQSEAGLAGRAVVEGDAVVTGGVRVELRSCDREPSPPLPPPIDPPPFRVLSLRASIMGLFIDQGSPPAVAQCAADQVIDRVGPSQLIASDNGVASGDIAGRIADAGQQTTASCRSAAAGSG